MKVYVCVSTLVTPSIALIAARISASGANAVAYDNNTNRKGVSI